MAEKDKGLQSFNYVLNGRLVTKVDGALVPDSHFQILENFAYNDAGIEGIGGMTKINAAATTYTKIQNGFHFKKTSPATESHVFIQTSSGTSSKILKSDNTSSVPAQDTFSDFVTLPTANTVFFTEAPDQSVVFCDGYTNYIWSGNEYRAAVVANFDPAATFFRDHTVIASNNLSDDENAFVLASVVAGLPASTTALYHFDNNGTDATSGTNLTATGATYSTSAKFGTHCASFDGTNDYFSNADPTGINLSGDTFTIDVWINPTNVTTVNPIYYAYTTNDGDSFSLYLDTDGSVKFLVKAGAATKVTLDTPAAVVSAGVWSHIALVENSDNFYIFVNGVLQASLASETDRPANYTGDVYVGRNSTEYYIGLIDELCITTSARWTANFVVPVVAYGDAATTECHMYIGSTRPLSGVKFYVDVANATAASCLGYEWTGSGWSALSSLVDGTLDVATSTMTLAVTGSITFTSTVSTSEVRIINENLAYFYYFVFSGIDATTALYQVTTYAPVQAILDIWDGIPRQIYSYLVYTAAYADETVNVYQVDYDASDATTYSSVGALTSVQYIYAGFSERLLGLKIYLGGTSVNTNAAIMTVEYWNGTTWTTVGTIDDGTSVSDKSFNRTGTVTWNPPGASSEFSNSVGNSPLWYYYRIRFSATLSATVRVDNISGIPVQYDIKPYRFPLQWQNRLWLINEQSNHRNVAIGSAYNTNCVFNGTDAGSLTFGGMTDLVCGSVLFTRYGGSIYENMILCKKDETYLVDGTSFSSSDGSGNYIVYKISASRGCIAPLTMKVCDTGYEVVPGLTKHTLVWLSASGVIMFDANSMIEISPDIQDRFDEKCSTYMNSSISEQASSFYDSVRGGYHLLLPTGVSTYPNEEWRYDVVRKKWSQIKRGAKYLWSGWEVVDSSGNKYMFGGTGDGYIERLEYGTTFDGLAITYKFRLPDGLLNNSWDTRKELRRIRLVGICKTTSTVSVTVSHYADGCTTASTPAITVIPQTHSGYRFYRWLRSVSFRGTTHSLEFSISTTNETVGFQPLFVGGSYRVIDYDLEAE